MTHEHGDHYNVFQRFLKKYGNQSDFRMDYFLFNAVSESECYNSNNPSNGIRKNLAQMNDNVKNGFKYIKVHTGQTFYFANMKLEILYTHEDTYPKGLEYFNNSSTVFKTTFMNGSAEGDTGIWTGDLERIGSRRLRAMWGREGMKADMVQVAHHGWNGVEAELYDLISPEIVWFPSNAARYRDTIPGRELDGKWWFKGVDYHICYKVDSVKIIIMSDRHNATMTFREGKVDRTWLAQGSANADHLRDLIDNAPLTHDNETIIFPSQR